MAQVDTTEYVSECCEAPPVDEVDEFHTGRCSRCKENAVFAVVGYADDLPF